MFRGSGDANSISSSVTMSFFQKHANSISSSRGIVFIDIELAYLAISKTLKKKINFGIELAYHAKFPYRTDER